jgi:hypothetical protein
MRTTKNQERKKLILEFVKQGLYPSLIAVKMNLSLTAVMKHLRQLEAQNIIERRPGKPIFFSMIPQTSEKGLNPMVSLCLTKPIHSAHKIRISIPYQGIQPLKTATYIKPFGRYKTAKQGIFKFKGYTIVTFKNKLNTWVHYPKGTTTKEQIQEARKVALMRLIGFVREHNLKLQGPLSNILHSHHVIEESELNEALKPLFREYETEIKKRIGSKICKTSHKGKIEHEGKLRPDRVVAGHKVAEGLEYLTLDFKDEFQEDRTTRAEWNQNLRDYSKQIKKHLQVLEEMNKTLKQIRKEGKNAGK